MLLVAADLRRQQPQHVIAQLVIPPWPDGKVVMIRHQTKERKGVRTSGPFIGSLSAPSHSDKGS